MTEDYIAGTDVNIVSVGGTRTSGAVQVSGNVIISGSVTIQSGIVSVQSGTHVIADIAESGMGVTLASGLYVNTQPSITVSGVVTVISGIVSAVTSISGNVVTVNSGLATVPQSGLGVVNEPKLGATNVYGRLQIQGAATVITSGHPDRKSIMINNEGASELRIGFDSNVASGVGFRVPADTTATIDRSITPIYGVFVASGEYISFYDELK